MWAYPPSKKNSWVPQNANIKFTFFHGPSSLSFFQNKSSNNHLGCIFIQHGRSTSPKQIHNNDPVESNILHSHSHLKSQTTKNSPCPKKDTDPYQTSIQNIISSLSAYNGRCRVSHSKSYMSYSPLMTAFQVHEIKGEIFLTILSWNPKQPFFNEWTFGETPIFHVMILESSN